jgi:hypothetical protein
MLIAHLKGWAMRFVVGKSGFTCLFMPPGGPTRGSSITVLWQFPSRTAIWLCCQAAACRVAQCLMVGAGHHLWLLPA